MFDLVIRNGLIVDGTGADRFVADIAVKGDLIVEVGAGVGPGRREIDADGTLVTPGFVDAHTHYDGQVTWDPDLSPSSWHGVTTAVMGNCGVGFAPVRPGGKDFLIRVMEGVEEIPGSALSEGMSWDWESIPEYLDALDRMDRAIDVVSQVPHSAVRCYVMGEERAMDDEATTEDIEQMADITADALRAGAMGFTTSRTLLHKVKGGGYVPGTHSKPEELLGIAHGIRAAGHGVFQMASDTMGRDPDLPWMKEIARISGQPLVFSMTQDRTAPTDYRETLAALDDAYTTDKLDIRASVPWRPPGLLIGFQATLNPFMLRPSYRELRDLSFEQRVEALRRPETKRKILSEESANLRGFVKLLFNDWDNMFPLGDPPDYEPPASDSVAARAAASGVSKEELAYDILLQDGGKQFFYYPLAYSDRNFDALHEMLTHPRSSASLSDGGAHVGTVCDASFTTYMLTHWARDRHRGPTLPLEEVIKKQTSETAGLYRLGDRGVIAEGKRADLNVIDLDALHLHAPYMAYDLPTEQKRLLQKADGYRYTFVAGQAIAEDGEMTGVRPGALVRGPQ